LHISWHPIQELNERLPAGVRVFEGADPSIPLRAWYVAVRTRDAGIETRIEVSRDADKREAPTDFARRSGALVVVNAGYFRMDLDPASHVGLLLVDGVLLSPALRSVLRNDQRYYLARAALGIMPDGSIDVAWVSSREGVLYEWEEPPQNSPEHPVDALDIEGLAVWPARHAVSAGPVLLRDGQRYITSEQEVFFGSTIPDIHPRTAACVDSAGDLLLLVVDGRQRDSRGVDLVELANLMLALDCEQAVNLDGGASSTLVVAGELVNRPAGGVAERQIMSAITVVER
jgi:exopolysaccharide biosynthesis protein